MADLSTLAVTTSGAWTTTGVWDQSFRKQSTITTLTDASATPTVLNHNLFLTGTTTVTITYFTNGVVGQTITIKAKGAITITHNAAVIALNAHVNFVMASGDSLTLTMFEAGVWTEVGRADVTA